VVAITGGSAHAIVLEDSASTTFIDLKLLAAPGKGILQNAGQGGTVLQKVSIIPGPPPKGHDGSAGVHQLRRLALHHRRARPDDGGLQLREHLR
jgi:hypothetical protein